MLGGNGRRVACAVLCAGLVGLYGFVGYTSPGYDDEFFTIRWIEQFGAGVVWHTQNNDVNPPGSYGLDWLIFELLGSWSLVRLVISLAASAAVLYAVYRVRAVRGDRAGVVAFLLIGLNPAVLMWCTGLRWYAVFVPLLLVLSFPPKRPDWRYWAMCFGGLLVLGYIGYAMLVVAGPLLYLYWHADPRPRRTKLQQATGFGSIFAVLYAYQAWVLVTKQWPLSGNQRSSLPEGVVGFVVAQVSNQGVFPLSLGGILSMAGMTGLLVISTVLAVRFRPPGNPYAVPYWATTALLLATGLAGKFRNFVVVTPWQGIFVSMANVPARWAKVFLACLACAGVGNLIGVGNVVTHSDTTKNSWNLPVGEVVAAVEAAETACAGDALVVSQDPVLSYVLEDRGLAVLGPFARRTDARSAVSRTPECLVVLRTYSGGRSVQRWESAVAAVESEPPLVRRFGFDPAFAMKQRLDAGYPEYQVEMVTLREPADVAPLQELLANRQPARK